MIEFQTECKGVGLLELGGGHMLGSNPAVSLSHPGKGLREGQALSIVTNPTSQELL